MNTHKGFTLIELMIVAAIVATFSTVMTVSMSGSTVKAKAASIVSNVNACTEAAAMYAANHEPYELADITADDVLKAYMPKWADYTEAAKTDTIRYKAAGGNGADEWAVTVDFRNDPDKEAVKEALQKIKGYNKYYDASNTAQSIMNGTYWFKVMLYSGKVIASADATSNS